ncbi:TetR family transcriptional regulator [Nonomuraea mesophila]|uniref:TetR family transcriptional regulator n=1 Tax=Nonomuraea mesophila TaxID=2530382 RepID=A0A4R5FY19_9ACTN|nr:TetR family transcriptional regulator C-terminal domain-containing protein [Nonomuraea mesophila]TDE60447.1 TetR family transcriptional regulator [Nonomuraea mesophila]
MPRLIDHEQRREELAEAAWRVIMRHGIGRVSVRMVAAEAGVSAGSLRHVFSTQGELLVFTMQLVVSRVRARITAIPPHPTVRQSVEAVARELLPLDAERRAEMEVNLALFSAATTETSLRGPREEAFEAVRDTCRWMISALDNGTDLAPGRDPEIEAQRLHAVIDGLATHLVYEPPAADTSWATKVLTTHLDSLAASAP